MLRLAALALLLTGCVHTQAPRQDAPEGRTDLNGRAIGKTAWLGIGDAPREPVHDLHVARDETTWVTPETGAVGRAPTDSVRSVAFARHADGGMNGAVIGGVLGYALAYGLMRRETLSFGSSPAEGAVLEVVVGVPLGALVGAARGDRSMYCRTVPSPQTP